MKRNILYSQEKEVRRSKLLYWKTLLCKNIGKTVDEDILNRRKNITDIVDKVELDKEKILEKIQAAFTKQDEMKKKERSFEKKSY